MTEMLKDVPIEISAALNGFIVREARNNYGRGEEYALDFLVFPSMKALTVWLEDHFTYRASNVKLDNNDRALA